jgi:hypothetical protein
MLNVPALGSLALGTGQESSYIPLQLDKDVPFILMGVKIQNGAFNVALWDPFNNPLMDSFEVPAEYASELPPFTVLEGGGGIECPAGAVFLVKLQGQ